MFLLDTNVISELRKAGSNKADKNVVQWAKSVPISNFFISVISILEIEMGILQKEKKDKIQGKILRQWLNKHVLPTFEQRILSLDVEVARQCAKLHIPNPKPERDAIIAATAMVHHLTIVTRNTKDFNLAGIKVLNPWESV